MVRLVQLRSQPEILTYLPKPTEKNLEFQGGVRGRVGASSLPEVKDFFDQLTEPVPVPMLPTLPKHSQRLRIATPLDQRMPMNRIDTSFARAQRERTRTAADMIGLSIDREALRRTAANRVALAVRPGFRERGQAAMKHAGDLDQLDSIARARYRAARTEQTRIRHRAVQEAHREETLRQPVVRTVAHDTRLEAVAHEATILGQWASEGARDVILQLRAFEGANDSGPPVTPGPMRTRQGTADVAEAAAKAAQMRYSAHRSRKHRPDDGGARQLTDESHGPSLVDPSPSRRASQSRFEGKADRRQAKAAQTHATEVAASLYDSRAAVSRTRVAMA